MNKEAITKLLNLSGIGSVITESPNLNLENASEGNRSEIWPFVDASGTKWIVKRHPFWMDKGDIYWIHSYMSMLEKGGYPVIRNAGDLEHDGQVYSIYEYAQGALFDANNPSHYMDMARKLAKLHQMSSHYGINGKRHWPTVVGYTANFETIDKKSLGTKFQDVYSLVKTAWEQVSIFNDLEGDIFPIHGDFRSENMRFDQNGITKVFDFGNARNDYPEVDVAITIRDLAGLLGSESVDKTQISFLREYQENRDKQRVLRPELILKSELVLGIQECTYLLKECLQTKTENLMGDLQEEFEHLNFLVSHLTDRQEMFREGLL